VYFGSADGGLPVVALVPPNRMFDPNAARYVLIEILSGGSLKLPDNGVASASFGVRIARHLTTRVNGSSPGVTIL